MQAQITAERESGGHRDIRSTPSGADQSRDRRARGRDRAIRRRQAGGVNEAQADAAAILARAEATAKAIRQIADAIGSAGGLQAVNLRVAEQYISEFGNLAKTTNTVILPTNVADVACLIAIAMSVVKAAPPAAPGRS